jgi:hypothetical protein
LGYVKNFIRWLKQLIEINKAQASLMAARGAFDPKLRLTLIKAIQGHRILFDFK